MEETVNPLQVRIIQDETSDMPETLGINEKRFTEIKKLMKHGMIDTDTFTDMAVLVSPKLKNANELLMLGVLIGRRIAEFDNLNSGDMLSRLFSGNDGKG